ncbi:MAG: hypothetical protein LBC53_02630 [Spirochaetaceae bacterium]|nr:hypothetical protein [Spirochaetaceae bacterium]
MNVGGTENFTYTIIVELKRLGHHVEYFTFNKGEISEKIEKLGVRFKSLKKYDLILANHTTVVRLVFKYGYTIQTCHGIIPKLEQPSMFADFHVSISYEIKEHLNKKGIDSVVIYNGIDCNRFKPEKPLHDKLTSVLSLCQSEEANDFIKNCCQIINVGFIKMNKYIESMWELEKSINEADMVVGIGRSAYDGMACGRAVLSFDKRSYTKDFNGEGDGYLTENNIELSLKNNCSGRCSGKKFNQEMFIGELKKYNKKDGIFLRNFALKELNINMNIQKYLELKPSKYSKWFYIKKILLRILIKFYEAFMIIDKNIKIIKIRLKRISIINYIYYTIKFNHNNKRKDVV